MTTYQILSIMGVPSLIVSLILYIIAMIKSRRNSNELIRDGILAILHNKIYTLGKQHIENGEITVQDFDEFEHLYTAYHNLGGNGTGTEVFNRVKALPYK